VIGHVGEVPSGVGAGKAAESARALWRQWMLLRGPGGGGWESEALRSETWLMLDERLRGLSPGTLTGDGVRWATLRFRLHRWHGAGASGGAAQGPDPALEQAEVAAGDLEALKRLADPPPGLYLLSVRVDSDAGTLHEARWLLFAPWRVRFYAFDGERARDEAVWRQTLAEPPAAQRTSACLSFDSTTRGRHPGPYGRWRSFGAVAEAPLELVPGHYRFTVEANDGVRAWARDTAPADGTAGGWSTLAAAWDVPERVRRHAALAVATAPLLLRVEYFQWKGDYALCVRCQPDSPAADAWVAQVLGRDTPHLRRWLFHDGTLLEGAGRTADARKRFEQGLAIPRGHGTDAACEEAELLAGLARTSFRLGEDRQATEYYERSLRLRAEALGAGHKETLVAALEASRGLQGAAHAEAQALRHSAAVANAGKIDEKIAAASAILRDYPQDQRSLQQRFELYGRRGLIREAGADIETLLRLAPSQVDFWYRGAVVRLALGDVPGYRSHCEQILSRFGKSTQSGTMRRVVKTCCLVPEPFGGDAAMLRIALGAEEAEPTSFWSVQSLALARYRAGEYELAAQLLESERREMGAGTATNKILLAMALYQCGDVEAAREHLEAGRLAIAAAAVPDGAPTVFAEGSWHDWLVCRILAGEAEALMGRAGQAEAGAGGATGAGLPTN
jgi:tetratricopeptide (TPR) repeat protein